MVFSSKIKLKKMHKVLLGGFFLGLLSALVGGYLFYQKIYAPNVLIQEKGYYLYIPTGANYSAVLERIEKEGLVRDMEAFRWVAQKKGYDRLVKAGKYHIPPRASNNELVDLLRSGKQEPVNLTFNNMQNLAQLAGKVASYIEADSLELLGLMENPTVQSGYGFSQNTFLAMFIPNTYRFFWNTSAEEFLDRMHSEYDRFWNDKRRRKAEKIGLTPIQVSTLASIVERETVKTDEMPRIAGVYMNRYNRGMKLDADPTLKFAWGDFSIKRVLNKHKEIDSPYNTYKNRGLPPGPIYMASITAINAVLHYEKHKYLYFCAKEDFSGYHRFASNLRQHNANARRYQRELNKRRIYK